MSSGFVSGGVADFTDSTSSAAPNATPREEDSWTKAEEAVKLARWQQEEKGSAGKEAEEKSLFEILQANKGKPHYNRLLASRAGREGEREGVNTFVAIDCVPE